MIDVRCMSTQPGQHRSGETDRCQLLAGHESTHAVMFCRDGRRTIRTWRDSDPTTVRDQDAADPHLPWAIGMPRPAWGTRV